MIRPSGYEDEKLPVAVWIHGGGYYQGGGVDRRYNMSFIVEHAVDIGHPIIAVGINYRLSAWGFLNSREVFDGGDSNMGSRDQRLSLHWLQENIAAFGGDPDKVTIWGQSAGAFSVGDQLLAFNGRDDKLFRSAIMESGGPAGGSPRRTLNQAEFDLMIKQTGCDGAGGDPMDCLRRLPFAELNSVINTTDLATLWSPRIDNDFLQRPASQQLADGDFVHVPIIAGVNSDEGTSVAPTGIDTERQFRDVLREGTNPVLPKSYVENILKAYPLHADDQILANQAENWAPPADLGTQYRRVATYYGDEAYTAPCRLTCETWARSGLDTYCFRFNAVPSWATYLDGATHFVEVAFAQLNLLGVGYMPFRSPPFQGLAPSYAELAKLMSGDWITFVATGDPNGWKERTEAMPSLGNPIVEWPKYEMRHKGRPPVKFMYEGNVTSSVEEDTVRKDAIRLINNMSAELDR